MKNRTQILILFFMLLVIPTSTVFACGNSFEKEKPENISCSKEENHSPKKSCCYSGEKKHDECNGACGNTLCHYPSSVNLSVVFNDFELTNTNNYTLFVNEWTYVQHVPKSVSLSIWQPPKIS